MAKYVINGGRRLEGTVTISGGKNAAVAILPAALLVSGKCRVENVPDISDVRTLLDILADLGADITYEDPSTVILDCTNVNSTHPNPELVRKMRASYYLMGALLSRFQKASVALPGGCNFAARPIDQHIKGFRALGAKVQQTDDYVHLNPGPNGLQGSRVSLDVVSVGATVNIILAACLLPGKTIIENAAKEPHIVDLANFLNTMGARISGAGTDTIKVTGVEKLEGHFRVDTEEGSAYEGGAVILALGVKHRMLGLPGEKELIGKVIPQTKQDKAMTVNVLLALAVSCLFTWLPVLNTVSAGLAIVICTVIAAAVCSVLFPVEMEEEA